MITPTLFVGLGTTGTNILKELRKLMSEEYGHLGLPLFRYIAIETNGEVEVQNTNQMKDYERINLISATIPTVIPIRHKLTPGDPLHNPQLVNWLNPELLKIEAGSFIAGASNIRMAGRLCLWENWPDVQSTFRGALGAIIAPETTRQTEDILTQRKKIDKNPIDTDGAIKIYVVGSLCGGSCSGMLIDVAYFFRHLLRGHGDQSKVFGMFTMFDENHAAQSDDMVKIRAANCYASLLELNYYHHQDTTYDITFPDGRKIENERKKPFDYTLFVSPSGKIAGNQFVKANGSFDEEGLNLMVALNLFAESAADTGGRKEEIRTNFIAHGNFGTLKPVPQGKIRTMIRYMASFGLTAVWYPKYRIATAAACLISKELCDNWLAAHIPQATTVKNAETEWRQILQGSIDTLTSPSGQSSIKGRIETHLARAKQLWLNKEISSNQLSQNMEEFPTGDSFKKKFEQGGEYIELMKMQVSECQKVFRNAIKQTLNNQLGGIDFSGTHGLQDVRIFFETLDKEVKKTIQNCPERMPSLDLRKLDFEPMGRSNNSFWLKSLWLREPAVKSHQNNLIDQYCTLIIGGRTSFYESVRNYCLRPILQEIRTELGFGVIPTGEDGPNRPPTIKERLDKIEGNLTDCIKEFKNEYDKAIDPPRSECVKIVANNSENRINTDAETLRHQISQSDEGIELLRGESMATFFAKEQTDIITQMTETYRQQSLDQIQVDDVVTKAQELLDSGNSDIQNLASRSNPYQMFTPTYIPFTVADSPNIIFGQVGEALTNLNNSLSGQGLSFGVGQSSVDHLLFFYQEEAGFALDDLVVQGMLVDKFGQTPGEYGHSTHQDPNFYNLELYDKTQKLKRWCQVLAGLVPAIRSQIDRKAFDGVFQLDRRQYVYEYTIDRSTNWLGLQNHESGIKELCMKQNEKAYQEFFNKVYSSFSRLDRQRINESIIKPSLLKIEDLAARNKINGYYNRFLDEVYSNNTTVNDAPSNVEIEVDAYFSQISSPAPEETQRDEAKQAPPEQTENTSSESVTDQTTDTDDYEEVISETKGVGHNIGAANQSRSTNSDNDYEESVNPEETNSSSENTLSPEVDEDETVWRNVEPETDPSSTEEFPEKATIKESSEQQPQTEVGPETVKQKKQTESSKEFSVANVDLKPIQRSSSTRKKE